MTDDLASDPHADWPDRTPMYDADGTLLLVFTLSEATRSGRPWADGVWRPEGTPVETARDAVLSAFPDDALSTSDRALADALLARGAERLPHAHTMSHTLDDLPAPRSDQAISTRPLSAESLLANAEQLGELSFRAYPPGHPDYEHTQASDATQELRGIALGEILGPYLDISQAAYMKDTAVGACLVVDREGMPPDGGPWVVDIFRDPDVTISGIGRALLSAALHAARDRGLPGLSLAVSHENTNALGLYASLGFVDAGESWTVAVPS